MARGILRVKVPPNLLRDLTAALADASWADFRQLGHALTPLVWAFVLGSTLGAIVLALIAYRVALAMIIGPPPIDSLTSKSRESISYERRTRVGLGL